MPILAQNFLIQDNFDRDLGKKYYLSEISLWLYRISYDFSVLYFCYSIYHEFFQDNELEPMNMAMLADIFVSRISAYKRSFKK